MTVRVSKSKLWKAIRANCTDCVGTPYAIKDCMGYDCKLYPYRFGKASVETGLASEIEGNLPDSQLPVDDFPLQNQKLPARKTSTHWKAKKANKE